MEEKRGRILFTMTVP